MLLLKVMDKKINFLIVGLQKTIYDQFSKRTHQDSNPVELIVLPKMVCLSNQSCSWLFCIHNRKLYNIFFSINLDLSLYPVNHSTTQVKKRLLQRNIFSLLSPTSSLFWHSYSDCIERHRSGKMREVEIYGPRINVDWLTGEDAFLSSQSALLLLNEGSAVIERPFATFVFSDSYNYLRKPLKDGPKIPSSCNNKSESFTNCYIEVGGSGS